MRSSDEAINEQNRLMPLLGTSSGHGRLVKRPPVPAKISVVVASLGSRWRETFLSSFRPCLVPLYGALALLAVGAAAVRAEPIEVWMPETGEVQIEALPRGTPEEQRLHALALIGAGQYAAGIFQLRELIKTDPGSEWVPQARLAIARGLIASGHANEAFDELDYVLARYGDGELASRATSLQFTAARAEAMRDVDSAAALYDRLIERLIYTRATLEDAARACKEKADAFYRAGRYLEAGEEYKSLVGTFPDSQWRSYCAYMVAECEWQLATTFGLGLERTEMAERSFRDFVDWYPADSRAAQARDKTQEARGSQATIYWETALYYVDAARKPWGAVSYLEHILKEFPDTPEAEWAARELARVRGALEAPLRGEVWEMALPGVTRAAPEQQTPAAPAPSQGGA